MRFSNPEKLGSPFLVVLRVPHASFPKAFVEERCVTSHSAFAARNAWPKCRDEMTTFVCYTWFQHSLVDFQGLSRKGISFVVRAPAWLRSLLMQGICLSRRGSQFPVNIYSCTQTNQTASGGTCYRNVVQKMGPSFWPDDSSCLH